MESKNHYEEVNDAAEIVAGSMMADKEAAGGEIAAEAEIADADIELADDTAAKADKAVAGGKIVADAEIVDADVKLAGEIEETIEVEEESKEPVRVNEIPELRGENSKVYRMSDGTEQAVFFAEPVHVFDEETQCFVNVDRTLVKEDGAFVSRQNAFTAAVSNDAANDELFSIADEGHRVTVLAMKTGAQKKVGLMPVLTKKTTMAVDEEVTADSLVFAEAEAGADFAYSLMGNGVKEDIVVKEKADVYLYSFLLRCENVKAQLDEAENRIAFMDLETGDEVFHIPAPFMTDADGAVSPDVSYAVKELEGGNILLSVTADSEWINAEERVLPVVIDPQIKVSGSSAMTTYSWQGSTLSAASTHTVGTSGTGSGTRMYMKLAIPALPRNPRIKKAELKFFQSSGTTQCGGCPKFGLYQVNGDIAAGGSAPAFNSDLIDYDTMKTGHCENGEVISYSFDITKMVDAVNKGETTYAVLVMKMLDETSDKIVLYGSTSSSYAPQLVVTYESSYGVNSSYRTHTHELGRFGRGSIDLVCGNLMFESEDFTWAGNRMPVTLRHLYNSALAAYQYTANSAIKLLTADFSAMKLGFGFKLNLMQSMVSASFQHDGAAYSGYVYVDENGNETYFKKSSKTCRCAGSSTQCYNLYEDVDGGDMLYDPVARTLTGSSDKYLFDEAGRLIKITDENGNSIVITYTSGRITSVTDGAGRVFAFAYNASGFLTSITAPDGTNVLYTYSGNLLASVTYPGGQKAAISYSSNLPTQVVLSASGTNVYKAVYTFSKNRLASVTEYGVDSSSAFVKGVSSAYTYSAAARTATVSTTEPKDDDETADNVVKTVYTFDNDGNVVSTYVYSKDTGNVGGDGEGSGINPHSGDGGADVISNINNLLTNHSFASLDDWTSMEGNRSDTAITSYAYEPYAKFGKKVLRMESVSAESLKNGVYQLTTSLPKGEYTFSAFIRIVSKFSGAVNSGAYLRVTTTSGTVLAESEHIAAADSEYTRLIAPFSLSSAQSVKVQILFDGKGTVYADAAQLENNAYANDYNMLENGNFERGTDGWTSSTGVSASTGTKFNMSKSLCVSGDLGSARYASQKVTVKTNRSTRETFTLSGWAKGYGIVDRERSYAQAPQFRLRAVVKYYDTTYKEYGTETYTADFSPCTEEWQLASVTFSKAQYRTIEYITVYCDYSYNCGTAYFDDIQLIRESIEMDLSASDFVVESGVSTLTGSTVSAPVFSEAKDAFGNALTETTFTDGEFGTIYRSFGYNADNAQLAGDDTGNNLVRETDARGNKTTYTVNSTTSRNEEVTDRLGNKTAYEYDKSGRTTKVTSKNSSGTQLANVSYAYDSFDNMTEIARGDGMKYVLAYNAYHNLESIGINGKSESLVKYTYKNGNGRLKQLTYANGDTMKATYNSIGQLIAEKWYNASGTLTAHYKYVYDGQENIVRSIDMPAKVEYTYAYEDGRIVRAAESTITLSGEIVTAKTLVCSTLYTYGTDGTLTKKRVIFADGSEQVIYSEKPENGSPVVKFTAGGNTVTSHSKTDSFGRKVFDELQLGTGFVSRQFSYHTGEVTAEHKDAKNLKSSPTTQLVSRIVLSDGRTISYEYDKEERITKVTDSVDGTFEYTYDALGQLLTEKKNGTAVNTMTYDNYGNIKTKNGTPYTYGDSVWKDLLTKVGTQTISYDKQGNPTSYLGHTLTWEKGRQLKKFDSNTYTYNANGIRTSKTVGSVKHTYTLDGAKILRETWGSNTLIPLYDNEESVCGIIYNGTPYYFQKNLQGDIIGIVDKDAKVVAKYSYDAWGVCTITQDASDCGIATVNPFRYRGYYFDTEIGMYYLQSRYYDPKIGRWINADQVETLKLFKTILINNLFTYCNNAPIDNDDVNGYFSFTGIFKSIKNIVSFGWGSISIKLSREASIVVGMLALLYRVFSIVSDIKSIYKFTNSKVATAIVAALPYGSACATAEIIAWACNIGMVVALTTSVLSFVISCCTGGIFEIGKAVLLFILSYFAPTLISAVLMLYNGFKKKMGCVYTLKLIGGSSVTFK